MLHIGIDPNLFSLGSFTLGWHGVMTALAAAVGTSVLFYLTRKAGFSLERGIYSLAIWAIICAVAGARLLHVLDHWEFYRQNLLEIARVWDGGLALYGAILGGSAGGAIYAWISKFPAGEILNLGAFGAILAQAIGRVGCLINGDIFGKPTSLPWGLVYTNPNSAPFTRLNEARHPCPLYEIAWDLLVLGILIIFRKRFTKDWTLFLLYISLYSLGRFFISFTRSPLNEPAVLGSLHVAQIVALLVLAVVVPLLIYLQTKPATGVSEET